MYKTFLRRSLPLVLTLIALGLSLSATFPWLQSFGWWLVSIQLPGTMLLLLTSKKEDNLPPLELLILGGAIGYAFTTIVILVVAFTVSPINISLLLVIFGALTFFLSIWVFWRRPELLERCQFDPQLPKTGSGWFGLIVVLFLIVTHLNGLGYSEYQGDELDAIEPSWSILAGNPMALLSHHRGPTQSLVATSFARILDGYPEGPLRLPYALAGLWAAGALYILTRHLFGSRVALIAVALYALEGLTIGFGRILQYQGILFLVQIAPLICFVRFSRAKNSAQTLRWLVLGAFLLGYAYLTHYEALFIGLVSVPLLWQGRHNLSEKARWGWGLATLIFLVMVAYYIPFFTATNFSGTAEHYRANRIGLANFPHNNLNRFIAANLFYNSIYFFIILTLGAIAGLWLAMRVWLRRPWWAIVAFTIGLALLAIGGKEALTLTILAGSALLLPVILIVCLAPPITMEHRLLGIWLFSYWVTYTFLISAPDLHFYELVAPWIIWASIGIDWGISRIPARLGRPAAVATVAVWLFMAVYPFMAFVMVRQEMLLTFSESSLLRLWTLISQRATSVALFGVPHREGWAAIGALYRNGTLVGDYKSNGGNVVPRWYIGARSTSHELPTYVFVTDHPFRQTHQAEAETILASGRYRTVAELHAPDRVVEVYQLDAPENRKIETHDLVNLTDRYNQIFDIDEAIDVQEQAIFWESAARVVSLFAPPGSKIEVCPAAALPIMTTSMEPSHELEPGCNSATWQVRGGEYVTGHNGWMFGNVAMVPPADQSLAGLSQTNFQEGIRLVGSKVTPELELGQLTIHFAWTRWAPATAPRDYTLFAHLIDGDGNLVAQLDREIDTGDRALWQREVEEVVDDSFILSLPVDLPFDSYPLVIGLYYWETGEHLAIVSASGEPGDTFLWLGDLQVQPETANFNYAGAN